MLPLNIPRHESKRQSLKSCIPCQRQGTRSTRSIYKLSRSQALAWELNLVGFCLNINQGGRASNPAFLARGKERDGEMVLYISLTTGLPSLTSPIKTTSAQLTKIPFSRTPGILFSTFSRFTGSGISSNLTSITKLP